MKKDYTLFEIVTKLTGNIVPCGCSCKDEQYKENLNEFINLTECMIESLTEISKYKSSHEHSVKTIGLLAEKCLNNIANEYICPLKES